MAGERSSVKNQFTEITMTSSDDQPIRSSVTNTHTISPEEKNNKYDSLPKGSNSKEQLQQQQSNSPDYKSCVFNPPEGQWKQEPIRKQQQYHMTCHDDSVWSHVEAAMLGCRGTVAGLLQGVGVSPVGNEDREKALWRTIQGHSH